MFANDVTTSAPPITWRKKIVFALACVATLLMIAEGGLRLRDWLRFGTTNAADSLYVSHPTLGKALKPGAVLDGAKSLVTINSLGFRGPEIATAKPPGTYRIACLGASTTFGYECSSNETTWPARLERLLRDHTPDASIEVINAAVPGYTLSQSLVNLRERVLPLQPDLVVIYHAPNDLSYEQRRAYAPPAEACGGSSTCPTKLCGDGIQWLAAHSALVSKVTKNVQVRLAAVTQAARHDTLPEQGVAAFRDRLTVLVDEAQAVGCDVVLCTVATQFRVRQPADRLQQAASSALYYNENLSVCGLINAYGRFNQIIGEVARQRGAAFADVFDAVPGNPELYVDSIHFTDAGTQLVAQCVFAAIRDRTADGALSR